MKECKVRVAQMEDVPAQEPTEFRRPFAVTRIGAIVFPTTVVQEGEQFDNLRIGAGLFGDAQAVLANPLPVRDSVDTVKVHYEPLLGNANDLLEFGLDQIRCRHDALTLP